MSMSSDGKIWAISSDEQGTHINNSVEVYERRGDKYYPLGQVLKPDYVNNGNHGYGMTGITLSGDGKVLIVGAIATEVFYRDGERVHGFVVTYRYINEQWTIFGEVTDAVYTTNANGTTVRVSIVPPNHTDGSRWGKYMATNDTGDLVAINEDSGTTKGGIWRYNSANDTWNNEYTFLTQSNGVGMTTNGNKVVTSNEGGEITIYEYTNDSWNYVQSLNFEYQSDDRYGRQMALSGDGNTISVSAANESSNGNSYIQVYRYSPDASYNWTQLGTDILGKNYVGDAVTMRLGEDQKLSYDGNTIAIGGNYNIAYLFKYINGNWEKIGYDFNANANSVALSQDGNTFAFGDRSNGNGTARAYQISYEPKMNIDNLVINQVHSSEFSTNAKPILLNGGVKKYE